MCFRGREGEGKWEPLPLRRGRAAGANRGSLRVRILCGAYDLSSPFIEGGCAADWVEDLAGPEFRLECPRCGKGCSAEMVGCAREMLETRSVFVLGCSHKVFTFSLRSKEPYFSVGEPPGGSRESG